MPETSLTERLRGLIDAGIALGSELSLDELLQKLVETSAALTGARYAALGVIDGTGTELERFLTTGIDPETHAAIGELPRGLGILGVLIENAEPLRLESIGEDPRSVGFPPNHPPMRGFLGVPIVLRGRAYGNLYLTEKVGGAFTAEDQELVETLATQAAVAIEERPASRRFVRGASVADRQRSATSNGSDRRSLIAAPASRSRRCPGYTQTPPRTPAPIYPLGV